MKLLALFSAVVIQPSLSVAQTNLIVNGDFVGTASPWLLSGKMKFSNNDPASYNGVGNLTLVNYYRTKSEAYQEVNIPYQGAKLYYMLRIDSKYSAGPLDWFSAGVTAVSSSTPSVAKTYTNLNPTGGVYMMDSIDLTAFAGQRVRITFGGNSSYMSGSYSTYRLDAVRVTPNP